MMTELSKKQEQQTKQILVQMPVNVLLVQDSEIVFQNKHVEKLVHSFKDEHD
jgi:c-di-AMP phosphodiesterase-like protein